jgi:hypothetical protein
VDINTATGHARVLGFVAASRKKSRALPRAMTGAGARLIQGASEKKEKENKHEKKNLAKSDRPTFPFFSFFF